MLGGYSGCPGEEWVVLVTPVVVKVVRSIQIYKIFKIRAGRTH